jgi:hypothetical protein
MIMLLRFARADGMALRSLSRRKLYEQEDRQRPVFFEVQEIHHVQLHDTWWQVGEITHCFWITGEQSDVPMHH